MTREQINVFLAATLTTLAEMNVSTPESSFYLALNMNLEDWNVVRHILITADLATIKSNLVTLTDKGREMANKIEAHIAGK